MNWLIVPVNWECKIRTSCRCQRLPINLLPTGACTPPPSSWEVSAGGAAGGNFLMRHLTSHPLQIVLNSGFSICTHSSACFIGQNRQNIHVQRSIPSAARSAARLNFLPPGATSGQSPRQQNPRWQLRQHYSCEVQRHRHYLQSPQYLALTMERMIATVGIWASVDRHVGTPSGLCVYGLLGMLGVPCVSCCDCQ